MTASKTIRAMLVHLRRTIERALHRVTVASGSRHTAVVRPPDGDGPAFTSAVIKAAAHEARPFGPVPATY